jgi:hypothetical protein
MTCPSPSAVGLSFALAATLVPAVARSNDDWAPVGWGAVTAEVLVLPATVVVAACDGEDENGERKCSDGQIAALGVGIVVGLPALAVGSGYLADALDAPAEGAFVVHRSLWGAALGYFSGCGAADVAFEDCSKHPLPWITAGVFGTGAGVYSAVRGSVLHERADLQQERWALIVLPPLSALFAGGITAGLIGLIERGGRDEQGEYAFGTEQDNVSAMLMIAAGTGLAVDAVTLVVTERAIHSPPPRSARSRRMQPAPALSALISWRTLGVSGTF